MEEKEKKRKGAAVSAGRKKFLLWLIPLVAVVAAGAVTAVVLLSGRGGADDDWLRKALAEDSVRTIELNETVKSVEGYEVNGTKTLTGTGKISMNAGSSFVLSVNTGASLTVDGVTLNVKNVGSNGVVVRAGGKLIWDDGVISYPKQYAIISYGDVTVNGGTFEYAGSSWLYLKSGTTGTITGGQFTKSGAVGIEVEEDAALTVSGNPVMERAGTNTVDNNGTLIMTGGTISQCETWTITNHKDATLKNVTIKDCALKGSLYNYKGATALVEDCEFVNCKTYQIYNEGVATVKNTLLANSNASTVNNKNEITLEGVTI
ncbi:MAG: right-handed parallel beta-helix repeat-containing protein, partial [Oscillospiraceae bacterium]|nr:right-handed parallel beta-helix repeat-containing protein [Oscillospiraceae bacterium]